MSHQSDLIAEDINAYLAQHEHKELLRFLTCGSVDDGKSTLIGRLLYDSKMVYEDQLAAVTRDSERSGTVGDRPDLALLMDGLAAEREQGITIDVAYRYFSTSNRKFIIADTPGHEQYTRNMATGASNCDLSIILVDARKGLLTQTRRHTYIAKLLGIRHVVVAVNKMDLIDFDQATYNRICDDYRHLAKEVGLSQDAMLFVPISALDGDNVVNRSERCPWYEGQTLMGILDSVKIDADNNYEDLRLPVQYVNRPNLDFRGFCGTLASGVVAVGDKVKALPSGKHSTVKAIINGGVSVESAFAGQAITLTLNDEIDISRGDMIVHEEDVVEKTNRLRAHLIWMSEQAMLPGREYLFKFSSKMVSGQVSRIDYKIDVNTQAHSSAEHLDLNDIAMVEVALHSSVVAEPYACNRSIGAFILIDRMSNNTVGAGMVEEAFPESEDLVSLPERFSEFELELNALIRKHFPHWQAIDLRTRC